MIGRSRKEVENVVCGVNDRVGRRSLVLETRDYNIKGYVTRIKLRKTRNVAWSRKKEELQRVRECRQTANKEIVGGSACETLELATGKSRRTRVNVCEARLCCFCILFQEQRAREGCAPSVGGWALTMARQSPAPTAQDADPTRLGD